MILTLGGILTPAELDALEEAASDAAAFRDGAATAGRRARQVKTNRQLPAKAAAPVVAKVEAALRAHPVFHAAAWPRQFVGTLVSRYDPGMAYGTHVDDALMQGVRTDLSFTLFLSDPDTYEGGALVIEDAQGERGYRLERGHAVLYPSAALHRVDEVRRGTRLAVVGWVRSVVRDPRAREILFDLSNVIASLEETGAPRMQVDTLAKTRTNLLRMWAED